MAGNKLLLVTPPDDVFVDALRILLVGISPEKTNMISDALTKLPNIPDTVLYMWNSNNPVEWLIDKKHKAQTIIFDVDGVSGEIAGYLLAQKNSHYFGIVKDLGLINNSTILDGEQCYNILENVIKQYETQ